MKRTLALLVTLALTISMLVACGGNSGEGGNSGGFGTSKVLSEYLAKEDTICYKVKAMDKAETPENIYFFKDGKVTIIPGKEFGLTMGDFSKMTDKEIWEKLEEVKVTYAESYKEEHLNKAKNEYLVDDAGLLEGLKEGKEYYGGSIEGFAEGIAYGSGPAEDIASSMDGVDFDFWEDCKAYVMGERVDFSKYPVEEMLRLTNEYYDAEIAKQEAKVAEIEAALVCTGPFYDMPFYFAVETDSSGNNMASEQMVYPTLNYHVMHKPSKNYDSLGFALGLTGQYEIYDSTYTGLATSGSGQFCMREALEFDTLDSKNILVDQTKDELNALFEAEINARYE